MVIQISSKYKSTHLYPLFTNEHPLYDTIRKHGFPIRRLGVACAWYHI